MRVSVLLILLLAVMVAEAKPRRDRKIRKGKGERKKFRFGKVDKFDDDKFDSKFKFDDDKFDSKFKFDDDKFDDDKFDSKFKFDDKFDDKFDKFDPHLDIDPHDPHNAKAILAKLKPDLSQVIHNVKALGEQQEQAGKQVDAIRSIQQASEDRLNALKDSTSKVGEGLRDTGKTLESAEKTSETILEVQDEVLDGQESIKDRISAAHQVTRKVVDKLESGVRKDISKVSQNQKVILDKIAKGRARADNGIRKLLSDEERTRQSLGQIYSALIQSADANAKGQSKIGEALQASQAFIEQAFEEGTASQEEVLAALDSTEESFNKRADRVSGRQQTILQLLRESRDSVVAGLNHLQKEQGETQDRVKGLEKAVQKDISDVLAGESTTQHILDKCGSKCDLSRVNDLIVHLRKQTTDIENNVGKDIKGVLSSESRTQGEVDALLKNVLKELSSRTDGTLHELKSFEKELNEFVGGTVSELEEFGKEVKVIENTQEGIEHLLKKIHEDLGSLGFLKVGFGGGKGKSKF